MPWLRSILAAVTAAVLLIVLPDAAAAVTTYSAPIAGAEYAATSTKGSFAGVSSGDLPGYWTASVEHEPLGTSALVRGGSFSLTTYLNSSTTAVAGQFTGGTIAQEGGTSGCSDQHYAISASLDDVSVGNNGGGSGTLVGDLTHRRRLIFGSCVTYSATVSGAITLSV